MIVTGTSLIFDRLSDRGLATARIAIQKASLIIAIAGLLACRREGLISRPSAPGRRVPRSSARDFVQKHPLRVSPTCVAAVAWNASRSRAPYLCAQMFVTGYEKSSSRAASGDA